MVDGQALDADVAVSVDWAAVHAPNEVVSKRERGEWVALCAGGLGAAAASVRPAG